MYVQSDILIVSFAMQAEQFEDAIIFVQEMQSKFAQNPDDASEIKRDLDKILLYLQELKKHMQERVIELKNIQAASIVSVKIPSGFEKYWGSSVLW